MRNFAIMSILAFSVNSLFPAMRPVVSTLPAPSVVNAAVEVTEASPAAETAAPEGDTLSQSEVQCPCEACECAPAADPAVNPGPFRVADILPAGPDGGLETVCPAACPAINSAQPSAPQAPAGRWVLFNEPVYGGLFGRRFEGYVRTWRWQPYPQVSYYQQPVYYSQQRYRSCATCN